MNYKFPLQNLLYFLFLFNLGCSIVDTAPSAPPSYYTHLFDTRAPDAPAEPSAFRLNGYYKPALSIDSQKPKKAPLRDHTPNKPPNCYFVFQKGVQKEFPGMRQQDICSLAGHIWNMMSKAEKAPFLAEADEIKRRLLETYPDCTRTSARNCGDFHRTGYVLRLEDGEKTRLNSDLFARAAYRRLSCVCHARSI